MVSKISRETSRSMAIRFFIIIGLSIILTGCFTKPTVSKSAIVIFKTPSLKFYDRGFLTTYDDHIHLQVYNAGQVGLNLLIYKDRVCQTTFECLDANEFNHKYLSSNYSSDFLYTLFSKQKIYFKDKKNKILIKVK